MTCLECRKLAPFTCSKHPPTRPLSAQRVLFNTPPEAITLAPVIPLPQRHGPERAPTFYTRGVFGIGTLPDHMRDVPVRVGDTVDVYEGEQKIEPVGHSWHVEGRDVDDDRFVVVDTAGNRRTAAERDLLFCFDNGSRSKPL